jgi:hypothetical protein
VTAFLALYRGETVSGARLVALTADPKMVRDFAARLVTEEPEPEENDKVGLRLVEQDPDEGA